MGVRFGLEVDPGVSRGAHLVEDELDRSRADTEPSATHEQLVEQSLRATCLDRVAPRDTGIPLGSGVVVDVDDPQRAVAITLEKRDQCSPSRRGIEVVAIGGAVLLDEFEEVGQVVGVGPTDGDSELVQPTTSMRTISIT